MVAEPPPSPDETSNCLLLPSTLLSLTNPTAAGYLERRSNLSGWYTYHFSLHGSVLNYFELTHTHHRGLLVGTISLFRHTLTIFNTPKRRREIEILDTGNKLHVLRAATDKQLEKWATIFQKARNKIPPAKPFPTVPSASRLDNQTVQENGVDRIMVDPHLPVDHLCCVVHGIGVSKEMVGENMREFQESYAQIMSRVYPDLRFRVEFAFVHWRVALTSLDMHAKLLSVIPTPQPPHPVVTNPLREFMVHKIVDYVYYTHARYRRHILREVTKQLNEQVVEFKRRRPDFRGGISIVGHSLGAALCYDLMCRKFADDQALLEAEGQRLEFDAANLFCLGNPLGTLLALDPTIGMGVDMRAMPFRVYNVFKYHDPIATRLEPLLTVGGGEVSPVTVPCWFSMGLRESTAQWLGGLWGGSGKKEEDGGGITEESFGEERKRRIDFVLQASSTMEEVSTSWSALRAHTEYWANRDAMLFMVCAMVKSVIGDVQDGARRMDKGIWVDGGLEKGDGVEEAVGEFLEKVIDKAVQEFEGRKTRSKRVSGGWAEYLAMVGLGEKGR